MNEYSSCVFFGHSNFDYAPYKDKIKERIVDLIENRGVKTFYNGFRGDFDVMCAHIVYELKEQYPQIKNIMALSYIPDEKFDKPEIFDEAVYLLDNKVPLRFAISHTNRKLVETTHYIISGVTRTYGGAKSACDYARRLYKTIFYVVYDYSYCDYDWTVREWEEHKDDEQFVKELEEKIRGIIQQNSPAG